MKTLAIKILPVAMIALSSCGNDSENVQAPEIVQKAFNLKFKHAESVKWEKENDSEWEAEFTINKDEFSANFDLQGNWKETERSINEGELPSFVVDEIDENFSDYEIEEAEVVETANGISYECLVEMREHKYEVKIAENGAFSKQEIEDSDDED